MSALLFQVHDKGQGVTLRNLTNTKKGERSEESVNKLGIRRRSQNRLIGGGVKNSHLEQGDGKKLDSEMGSKKRE